MNSTWPVLEYSEWRSTYETLHRFVQIVGKFRLCKSPTCNHSWNSTLYVTSRGLTTSAIPSGENNMTVSFDFIDHNVIVEDSLGRRSIIPLQNESVASFYEKFMDTLAIFEVTTNFSAHPNELTDSIPFDQDQSHHTYSRIDAYRCFQALVKINNVFLEYRSKFSGKSSPVHFFWGSFDLAISRFSGRKAPEHPGGVPHLSDSIVKEAYSHEVMSVGFWPGNEMYPHPAFYAYAYPEPEGFSKARVTPPEAYYHKEMKEFILPYETVRTSIDPARTLMSFIDSAYRAAANLGQWERDDLEIGPHLSRLIEIYQSSFDDEAIRQ
jgi:hypothetical protein